MQGHWQAGLSSLLHGENRVGLKRQHVACWIVVKHGDVRIVLPVYGSCVCVCVGVCVGVHETAMQRCRCAAAFLVQLTDLRESANA